VDFCAHFDASIELQKLFLILSLLPLFETLRVCNTFASSGWIT